MSKVNITKSSSWVGRLIKVCLMLVVYMLFNNLKCEFVKFRRLRFTHMDQLTRFLGSYANRKETRSGAPRCSNFSFQRSRLIEVEKSRRMERYNTQQLKFVQLASDGRIDLSDTTQPKIQPEPRSNLEPAKTNRTPKQIQHLRRADPPHKHKILCIIVQSKQAFRHQSESWF